MKKTHTFTEYSSLRVKGSTVLFLMPFLPLDKRLFLHEVNTCNIPCDPMYALDTVESQTIDVETYFPTAMTATTVYLAMLEDRQLLAHVSSRVKFLLDRQVECWKLNPTENFG